MTAKATKKKAGNGRFKKGVSGNPGGRPKDLSAFRLAARAHTTEAIETLAAIMRNRKASTSARVRAIRELLDRGWGKPPQDVHVDALMASVNVTEMVTPQQRRDFAMRIAFALNSGAEAQDEVDNGD